MKERVFKAHGNLPGYPPESPFQKVDIRPQQYNKPAQQKVGLPVFTLRYRKLFIKHKGDINICRYLREEILKRQMLAFARSQHVDIF